MSVFESRVENYELPDSWGSGRLDEVCDQMKQGKILPQKEIHEIGRYPVLGANGCIGYCDSYFLEEERVLITCRGSTCGTINRSPEKSFVTNNAMILFEKDCLNKDFLFFALQEFSTKGLKTGSGQPQLTKGILNSHVLPLPPLPEQKKIAHILSTVQRAIEAQERIIQTTTELKKTLMHKLFTEGLRNEPQKQTEIGPVPETWEVKQLGEIAKIERGKFSHRPRNESRFYGGAYPFVQTGDVSNCDGYVRSYSQTLNEEGLAISKMFPAGTILITIAANIGFTGILQFDSACPDSLIGVSPSRCIETVFLNYYLMTQQPQMDQLAPKGTQKNINIQFLKPWPVPLPTLEEQKAIAEAFSATDKKISFATAKRDELQALFRTLLHELMTAKTRVHDLVLPNTGGHTV